MYTIHCLQLLIELFWRNMKRNLYFKINIDFYSVHCYCWILYKSKCQCLSMMWSRIAIFRVFFLLFWFLYNFCYEFDSFFFFNFKLVLNILCCPVLKINFFFIFIEQITLIQNIKWHRCLLLKLQHLIAHWMMVSSIRHSVLKWKWDEIWLFANI